MNISTPHPRLYPALSPHQSGHLRVSALHNVYWEVSGNPDGLPVIGLHGGPGGASSAAMRQYYNPEKYRIILFDQRGCGKSTPHSELRENTTFDLVADIEAIRKHLGIEKWVVAGGSWGSTLALTYSVTHPERVLGIILRGIFTASQEELRWFYQEGASFLLPDAYEKYIAPIPEDERDDLIPAFYKLLTGDDAAARAEAATAWAMWEAGALTIEGPSVSPQKFNSQSFVDAFARIECHYFINKAFFPSDGWLFEQIAEKLQDIPGHIVHGRFDIVTPLRTGWKLHKAWPKAAMHIVETAGHSASEPGIIEALIDASDDFANQFSA